MALQLSKKIVTYLERNPDEQFTAREIAQWICTSCSDECAQKKHRSQVLATDDDLLKQLVAEIGSQYPTLSRNNSSLKATQGRPRKYYFTNKTDEQEIAEVEQNSPQSTSPSKLKEKDLYPLLCQYLSSQHTLYPKRIDEKRSSNTRGPEGNRWLYPDLVAVENLAHDWNDEVKACVNAHAGNRIRLWSFEVKRKLNRSNIRECFFQAVSNSSWANAGYLVAKEISGNDTLKELRMLFGLHGIGLIRLDTDNPADSEILIPARERTDVDWNTCSRLANENTDFKEFIKLIRRYYQTGDLQRKDWDIPKDWDTP